MDLLALAIDAPHPPRTHSEATRKDALTELIVERNPTLEEPSTDPTKIDCICHSNNILTRPASLEETCFIFDTTELLFRITSEKLLSLRKLVTEVVYPFEKPYDFYRLNYNHLFNFYPVAIVRARKLNDIRRTIDFCYRNCLPIRARGGAHCYQPASLVNFGVVIDQIPRGRIVRINLANKTVKIQAGAILGPVVNQLAEKNLAIPLGTCCTNGLAGLTLGGGIGFMLREYGLTSDNVIDYKVVLADGKTIHANRHKHADLFRALSGAGGGNFGVVTDFTYKIVEACWVTVFTMNFRFDDTKIVLQTWQKFAPVTDTRLTSELDIFNRFQPIIVTGQLLPGVSPEADRIYLFELLKPLVDLGLHTEFSIKTMNLLESAQYFAQGSYARPFFFFNQSDFGFDVLPEEAIDVIIHFMGMLDRVQSFNKTEINALGGNFGKIPVHATAFPSRSAICWFQYTSVWETTNQQEKNMTWLREYYAALRPFFPRNRKYVNALDYDVKPIQALKSYFGPNLPELIKTKHIYDPTNFFRFEQSIPDFKFFGIDS